MAKPVLKYAGKQPPLAILAASKLSGIEIDIKEDLLSGGNSYETLVLPSGYALQVSMHVTAFHAIQGAIAGRWECVEVLWSSSICRHQLVWHHHCRRLLGTAHAAHYVHGKHAPILGGRVARPGNVAARARRRL